MKQHTTMQEVAGPWSLATSRTFWEGFAPAALPDQGEAAELRTVFLVDNDWSRAAATVRQDGSTARITVAGDGDLHAAATQTARFLSLDVDGHDGAFPAPDRLRTLQLDLPGRKVEYLHAVADAALDGLLDGSRLRDLDPEAAVAQV